MSLSELRLPSFLPDIRYYAELDSTNNQARTLIESGEAVHGTIVRAGYQTAGRGQMGNSWEGERGKNLYFSLILFLPGDIKGRFHLNRLVALACRDALLNYIPDIRLKWPNDLYSGSRKLGGILIENFVQGEDLNATVVGIGININQDHFENLNSAGSILSETGKNADCDEVFQSIIHSLQLRLQKSDEVNRVLNEYHSCLLFYGETVNLEYRGKIIQAKILGTDEWGRLLLDHENKLLQPGVKEIRWII